MGCGSSSLKGEQPGDVNTEAPKPISKTKTNFSTIDYDSTTTERRDTVYAPHESIRQKSDVLSPLTEKPDDPIQHTNPGEGVAAGSTHPQTTNSEGLAFQNTLAEHPAKQSLVTDQIEPKAPYHDVTASPTTPGVTNHLDQQIAQQASTQGHPSTPAHAVTTQ